MPQSRSMAGAVYSGRRKITFLEIRLGEVGGGGGAGWEHPLVPIMMWGSTANRGSHRHSTWHSSFWALLSLRCSWSSGHFVRDHWGTAGNPLGNMGVCLLPSGEDEEEDKEMTRIREGEPQETLTSGKFLVSSS